MDSKELKILTKEINQPLSWDISEKCQKKISKKRWKGTQRRIGITGGIASGKSSIGKYLQENKKLPILDADLYAKNILAPETKITKKVIAHFGKNITKKNDLGQEIIDRLLLGEIIFSDQEERLWLEKLIHPIVKNKLEKNLRKMKQEPIVIMIIPLLFEANLIGICSEIWVVSCSIEEQIRRLMKRNSLSKIQCEKRVNAQLSLVIKKELADFVIDNNQNHEDVGRQIDLLL